MIIYWRKHIDFGGKLGYLQDVNYANKHKIPLYDVIKSKNRFQKRERNIEN